MPKVDLAYCMTLPPKKAVEYLKNKGYAITWDWEELWQDAQAQAFTVAKATRLDILQDIREAVEKALTEGKTLAWFEKELTPVLKAKVHGWLIQKNQVLAFVQARPADGGAGALVVLLAPSARRI